VYQPEIWFLLGVSPWTAVGDVDPEAVVALGWRLLVANADWTERSTTGERGAAGSTGCASAVGNPAAAAGSE
jgi:hypothetical protein